MQISIITAAYNAVHHLPDCVRSVSEQSYPNIEHLIVDGGSTDGTVQWLQEAGMAPGRWRSEPDQGIYDALNKGIGRCSGDIIGFLHSDDIFYSQDIVKIIAERFSDPSIQAVYGDLVYVQKGNLDKVIRYWKSGPFHQIQFRSGWMPPHPTVYIRREAYQKYGTFRLDLGSAADYECLLRMLYKYQLNVQYIPQILVKMRVGGVSNLTWTNRLAANRFDKMAWQVNQMSPPFGLRFTKPLRKLLQFWHSPPALLKDHHA